MMGSNIPRMILALDSRYDIRYVYHYEEHRRHDTNEAGRKDRAMVAYSPWAQRYTRVAQSGTLRELPVVLHQPEIAARGFRQLGGSADRDDQ